MANISTDTSQEEALARYLRILGQTIRIRILLLLEQDAACVCHLEAYLGIRQAQISQHLMVLRDAGIVSFYREGRNIYYQLAQPETLTVIRQLTKQIGLSESQFSVSSFPPVFPCPCPRCNPDVAPGFDCSHLSARK